MKMIFAMLHSEDVDETVEELNKEKYWVTKLSTTGGFLKNKNVTLVIGTEDEQVLVDMEQKYQAHLTFAADVNMHIEEYVISNAADNHVLYSTVENTSGENNS